VLQVRWAFLIGILILTGCDSAQQTSTPAVVTTSQSEPEDAPSLDVESLLAMPSDRALGKAVAQDKCNNCHGKQGVSGRIGAPFIGGQSYEYLIRAMAAYTTGQRDHLAMKETVESLDSNALVNVSRYYATQTNAKWDPTVATTQSDKIDITPRTIAMGERLAKACDSCHGENGVSGRKGMPSLAGMHGEYFIKTLNEFFDGQRPHQIMEMFSGSVPKRDAEALAAYYSTLKAKKSANPIAGNSKAGRKIALKQCAGCHGTDGNSIAPLMPGLAGQDETYLVKTTTDYLNGVRKDEMMAKAVKGLSDMQILDVSAFFASQRPDPYIRVASTNSRFKPLADAGKIAKSCDGCHGPDGNSTKPGMPSLTGLTPDYLVMSTLSYRTGARKHKEMKLLVEDMSDLDIEKISYYYATKETKSSNMTGAGDVAEGKKQSAICASCHDKVGGIDSLMPTLAGQSAAYIIQASEDYINGTRQHRVMRDAVVVLPKEVLANIAAYYATLKPAKLGIRMPEAPAILAAGCDSCHGAKGYNTAAATPRLAGQVESYLARVLREYGTGERSSSPMHVNATALTHLESRAIASYYAAQ